MYANDFLQTLQENLRSCAYVRKRDSLPLICRNTTVIKFIEIHSYFLAFEVMLLLWLLGVLQYVPVYGVTATNLGMLYWALTEGE